MLMIRKYFLGRHRKRKFQWSRIRVNKLAGVTSDNLGRCRNSIILMLDQHDLIQATASAVGNVGDDEIFEKGVWRRVRRYRTENLEMVLKEKNDRGGGTSKLESQSI